MLLWLFQQSPRLRDGLDLLSARSVGLWWDQAHKIDWEQVQVYPNPQSLSWLSHPGSLLRWLGRGPAGGLWMVEWGQGQKGKDRAGGDRESGKLCWELVCDCQFAGFWWQILTASNVPVYLIGPMLKLISALNRIIPYPPMMIASADVSWFSAPQC